MSKKNLLSIGEVSKYTGASIRSLRYYEQMKILKPAHIDADSGYRYYAIDQLHHIFMIMFCIELGIPLKELAELAEANDTINLRSLLEKGKALAESKLKSLNNGLKLFEIFERQMDLTEMYPKGQIYPRKIEEKTFYVQPADESQTNINHPNVIKTFMEMPFDYDDFAGLAEFGIMYEYSQAKIERFVFIEIPPNMEVESKKTIPAGIYFCCLNENGQIERTTDIFKEQLSCKESFIAIEMEIVADKYEMSKPFYSELRVIAV